MIELRSAYVKEVDGGALSDGAGKQRRVQAGRIDSPSPVATATDWLAGALPLCCPVRWESGKLVIVQGKCLHGL